MALVECPECRGKVSSGAASCPHCGQPLSRPSTCPTCKRPIPSHTARFCPNCGSTMSQQLRPWKPIPWFWRQWLWLLLAWHWSLVALILSDFSDICGYSTMVLFPCFMVSGIGRIVYRVRGIRGTPPKGLHWFWRSWWVFLIPIALATPIGFWPWFFTKGPWGQEPPIFIIAAFALVPWLLVSGTGRLIIYALRQGYIRKRGLGAHHAGPWASVKSEAQETE